MRLQDVLAPALLAATLTAAGPARADLEHSRDTLHESIWLHWRTRVLPWTLQAGSAVGLSPMDGPVITPDDVLSAMEVATETWSEPSCTDLAFVYAGWVTDRSTSMTTGKDQADHVNKIVIRNQDWSDSACETGDTIACTTVVYRRGAGELLDADIDLNDRDFDFALDPSTSPGAIDLVSVLTHETGHFVGFDHSDWEESVMYPQLHPGELRRSLAADELGTLCETYPAGECTVANDLGQYDCAPAWQPASCACRAAPGAGRPDGGAALLLLAAAGCLFAHRKRAGRRSGRL